jgi:hypothetical protein
MNDFQNNYDPAGALASHAPRSSTEIAKLIKAINDPADNSIHDLLTSRDVLSRLRSAGGAEGDVAGYWTRALDNIMQTTPTNTGTSPAQVRDLLTQARAAHQSYANARDLQGMTQTLQNYGQSPAGEAQRIQETFYPQGAARTLSPQGQALADIANAGRGGVSGWNLMHALAHPVASVIGGAVGGPVGAGLATAVTHLAIKPAAEATVGAVRRGASQNAINNAYNILTGRTPVWTGQQLTPAMRALLFTRLAAMQNPSSQP